MGQDHRSAMSMRLGVWLGRVCRGYLSHERRLSQRLYERGVPKLLTNTVFWMIKLTALGTFLYVAFWVALITCAFTVAVWWVLKADLDPHEERPEWKNGLSGYGLYRGGIRIDPGSPDD